MDAILKIIGGAVLVCGTIMVFAILFALPIMWLWNSTCPDLFRLPEIGFWQARRLGVLCGFLFKSSTSPK